ncbi:hypothetical protein PJM23_29145, partial [Mycobacterium kansasii]
LRPLTTSIYDPRDDIADLVPHPRTDIAFGGLAVDAGFDAVEIHLGHNYLAISLARCSASPGRACGPPVPVPVPPVPVPPV